jgi:Starch synthase catalytic domain
VIQLVDTSPPGQAQVQRDPVTMDVVHVTAEMAPVAKVGGLGDVVQGLAKASAERGHNVQVHLPPPPLPHSDIEKSMLLRVTFLSYQFSVLQHGFGLLLNCYTVLPV